MAQEAHKGFRRFPRPTVSCPRLTPSWGWLVKIVSVDQKENGT